MIERLQHDALPLVRSGGVFLAIVGSAMVVGAIRFHRRFLLLATGAVAATIALVILAVPLSRPYGPPGPLQIWSLAAAVAFEVLLLILLVPAAARRSERAFTAVILGIVGAHFIIMTPAFGLGVLVLGLATFLNALIGAICTRYRLPVLWAVDGVLKIMAGLAMIR